LPERREIEDALRLIQTAGAALAAFRVDDARQAVLRIENLLPKAKWAHRAADDLKAMDDRLMTLRGGPLGEQLALAPAKPENLAETVLVRGPAVSADALPECLLILIDGGGSYLLHRGDRVSVGRAASAHPADIPIFSDLAERHADLARVEDDYFIFCPRDVQVNGVVVKQRLMQDGDRVTLGRRARFTFRLPSRRSASATLDMSDRSKLPRDVRRVVLFRGNAMIGNGPAAHLTCSTAVRPLVLFERAGQLWVRSQDRRGPAAEAQAVRIGESMEVEDVSFVVQPWATGETRG
jgi:hypothetical protein